MGLIGAGVAVPAGQPVEFVCAGVAADRHTPVRQFDLYKVSEPQAAPQLVARRDRVGDSPAVLDQEAFEAMATAQAARPPPEVARPRRPEQRDRPEVSG